MSQVDTNQNEEMTSGNELIYAIDDDGICHRFENQTLDDLQSKSIVHLSNQIDNSLQLTDFVSTQPFSILNLSENNLSSLRLFNNDISTPVLSPPSQLSGHIASQYQNVTLINTNKNISKTTKKKKKRKLRYHSHRFSVLKKQLKNYMKKKQQRQKQSHLNTISNILVHHQSKQIESSPIDQSTMIDFQLSPDLSKRKYIYKDINSSNNNPNQMNWRIFQCTQQSSSSCFDQTITNDRSSHPFFGATNPVSLPDIRIGLSRHHSIKQLHKTIID